MFLHSTLRRKKQHTTAIMSLTNCRFYEEKYPEVESFVMVNVKQIAEMGAYVKLLEYGRSTLLSCPSRDPSLYLDRCIALLAQQY